jgi:hypothetical protein
LSANLPDFLGYNLTRLVEDFFMEIKTTTKVLIAIFFLFVSSSVATSSVAASDAPADRGNPDTQGGADDKGWKKHNGK